MLTFVWLWVLVFLPLPWILSYWLKNNITAKPQSKFVLFFPRISQLSKAFAVPGLSFSGSWFNWQTALKMLAWLMLVVSLARPELIHDVAYANNTGYDLMLAVDLSPSMQTDDFPDHSRLISRITATKKVVSAFVQQRLGDRIGLIVFAEQAFLTVPLTLDAASVVKMLNNLRIGMAGDSTAIGDAIGVAVKNLRTRPAASRVLILLTDGANTSSNIPPLEAAKIASADKIKVYTIGIGGGLDDSLLKQIAEITGGSYAQATSVNALEEIYAEIDNLEKTEAKQKAFLIRTPLYPAPLIISLICIVILFSVNARLFGNRLEFT